jgi:hypothetical protein
MGISMDGKKIRFSAALAAACILLPGRVSAAVVEISAMLAYSVSDFADGYKSTQRRYSGSLAFKFTPVSALEFEYMNSATHISYNTTLGNILTVPTREVISYQDEVYSFNWVQNLVPSKWIIQPYVVAGGGRMTRRYTDELPVYGYKQVTTQNVVTGTGGVGLRIFLTRSMAVKAEAKTYVPNFQLSKWKENQMLSVGLSWTF